MYNFNKPKNPKYGDTYWKRNPDDSIIQLMFDGINVWIPIEIGRIETIEDEIFKLLNDDKKNIE
jgi:hypothetical protein